MYVVLAFALHAAEVLPRIDLQQLMHYLLLAMYVHPGQRMWCMVNAVGSIFVLQSYCARCACTVAHSCPDAVRTNDVQMQTKLKAWCCSFD